MFWQPLLEYLISEQTRQQRYGANIGRQFLQKDELWVLIFGVLVPGASLGSRERQMGIQRNSHDWLPCEEETRSAGQV
jgi:hypothetical protein